MKLGWLNRNMVSILLFAFVHTAQGQKIKTLTVGDECPDFLFRKMVNYPKTNLRLSDLKDRLVILDLGFKGCPPCAEGAVEFSSATFKEKFKDSVFVIWMVTDKKEAIVDYLKNDKQGQMTTIPIDCEGDLYNQYFQIKSSPSQVWIRNGKIIAKTHSQLVSYRHVSQALSGEAVDLPVDDHLFNPKVQDFVSLDRTVFKGETSEKQTYSIITKYNGATGGVIYSSLLLRETLKLNKQAFYNLSILELYQNILATHSVFNGLVIDKDLFQQQKTRYILEVSDPTRYDNYVYRKAGFNGNYNDWSKANSYCYESRFPLSISQDALLQKSIADLNAEFGVNGRIENRSVGCWVVSADKRDTNYFKDSVFFRNHPDSMLPFHGLNSPPPGVYSGYIEIGTLVFYMQSTMAGHVPVVVEQGANWTNKRFVKVSRKSLDDVDLLNAELNKYGLSVSKQRRVMQMLVVTENTWKASE